MTKQVMHFAKMSKSQKFYKWKYNSAIHYNHINRKFNSHQSKRQNLKTLRAGFEPAREDPIGFQVQRLNHSAIAASRINMQYRLYIHSININFNLHWLLSVAYYKAIIHFDNDVEIKKGYICLCRIDYSKIMFLSFTPAQWKTVRLLNQSRRCI